MHKLTTEAMARSWTSQNGAQVFYRLTDGRNAVCYLVPGSSEPPAALYASLTEHITEALVFTGSVHVNELKGN